MQEVKEGDYNGYNLVVGHLSDKDEGFAHVSNRGSNRKTVRAISGDGVFGKSDAVTFQSIALASLWQWTKTETETEISSFSLSFVKPIGTSNGCFGDWWKVERGCTKIEQHLASLRQSSKAEKNRFPLTDTTFSKKIIRFSN